MTNLQVSRDLKYRIYHYWFFRAVAVILLVSFCIYFVVFLLPNLLPTLEVSNSRVHGVLIQNQNWKDEVTIDGDIVTALGTTITISPGTKIIFAREGDKSNLDFLPYHKRSGVNIGPEIQGVKNGEPFWNETQKVQVHFANFIAKGEQNNPITITSDSLPGSPYDVNLISIRKGDVNFVNLSNYRRLEIGSEVIISNSNFNNTGDCAICIKIGTPIVFHNIFSGSKRSYLVVGLASPIIDGNKFLPDADEGIIFNGDKYANLRVFNNYFNIPNRKLITVIPQDQGGVMARNLFDSGQIILPCGSKVKIIHNFIKVNIVFNNVSSCSGTYEFADNFWGTTDIQTVIGSRIIGRSAKFNISVPHILQFPPQDLRIVN